MKAAPKMIAGLVLASSLVFVACSDDEDKSAETTEATAEIEPTTTMATDGGMTEDTESTPAAESMGTIVDVANADGRFTTLVAAVQAAGLDEALSGDGPFTVLAPTDDAYAALPPGTVDTLLADPSGALTDVLTYHVVEGKVMAADVVKLDGQDVKTLGGGTLTVGVTDEGVTLTDATGQVVNVIITDVQADNGVIHVIDAVLLPSA